MCVCVYAEHKGDLSCHHITSFLTDIPGLVAPDDMAPPPPPPPPTPLLLLLVEMQWATGTCGAAMFLGVCFGSGEWEEWEEDISVEMLDSWWMGESSGAWPLL